jgi:putative ABC transport system ATP-binding protein
MALPPRPADGTAVIVIRNVSRRYIRGVDEIHALDDVSLEIATGRFVAFMGPSGSGKSTLLNLVSGIDRPSAGEVVVAGQLLNELSEDELARWRARHVGLIFQFFNLLPVLSARDNVALPLLLTRLDRKEREQRAETALRIVGLEDRLDHFPRTLSGGEQQRVAIARAIVTDPDLIVADEPTGDLDARNAEAILHLLRELRRAFGKTVVMVTHDPRALRYVDDAYHLDKGVLLAGEDAARAQAAIAIAAGGPAAVSQLSPSGEISGARAQSGR